MPMMMTIRAHTIIEATIQRVRRAREDGGATSRVRISSADFVSDPRTSTPGAVAAAKSPSPARRTGGGSCHDGEASEVGSSAAAGRGSELGVAGRLLGSFATAPGALGLRTGGG